MENNDHNSTPADEQSSIFSTDDFSEPTDILSIKHARTALFVAAGVLTFNIFYLYMTDNNTNEYLWVDLLVWSLFVAAFIASGFYVKKKPYTAIIIGISLYAAFILINAMVDVSTIIRGIIMKLIIIIYLVRAVNDAKNYQQEQKFFNK